MACLVCGAVGIRQRQPRVCCQDCMRRMFSRLTVLRPSSRSPSGHTPIAPTALQMIDALFWDHWRSVGLPIRAYKPYTVYVRQVPEEVG